MLESTGFIQGIARSGLKGAGVMAGGPRAAVRQLWPVITQGPGSEQNKELMLDLEMLGNSRSFLSRRAPERSGRSGAGALEGEEAGPL